MTMDNAMAEVESLAGQIHNTEVRNLVEAVG